MTNPDNLLPWPPMSVRVAMIRQMLRVRKPLNARYLAAAGGVTVMERTLWSK